MFTELNDRLEAASAKVARLEKLERKLRQMSEERRALFQEVEASRLRLSREEADVERLSRLSVQGLFYSLMGTKEERLEKERQEAAAALLHYEEVVARREALVLEYEATEAEIRSLSGARREFDALLLEKKEALRQSPGEAELFRLSEELQQVSSEHRELSEALHAGSSAISLLSQVVEKLGSARSWGQWDMLGGGMLATMAKHNRIDEAKELTQRAQQALSTFQRELADVGATLDVGDIEIGGFSKFADFFFDGLIADWVVQNRIVDSLNRAESTLQNVSRIVNRLRSEQERTKRLMDEVQARKLEFITNYNG